MLMVKHDAPSQDGASGIVGAIVATPGTVGFIALGVSVLLARTLVQLVAAAGMWPGSLGNGQSARATRKARPTRSEPPDA
jgi:hypothetical protein